jgi:glycosyltransferase involved in cell wall biosynthesis
MQRYMGRDVPDLISMARSNGQRIINDVDDWFWGISEKNAAANFIDPNKNLRSNVDHYRRTLEASDLVTVSTLFLKEQIEAWGVPVRLIPNRVSAHMFSRRRHREGKPVVGWVGSTAHRSGDLDILREPFAKIDGAVSFHHTGDHPFHASFSDEVGLAADSVSVTPMLSPFEYPGGFTFDIGVVPLVDIPFNSAKSGIKGLEYAAAGIPFVASPLPEYIRLRDEYGIGRIASSASEWVEHIEELFDPAVRAAEADRQHELVLKHFHVKDMAKDFDDVVWA